VLDQAFVGLIGAGATTLAPAFDLDVPPGAVAGGDQLIALLCQENPAGAQKLVQTVTSEIWSSAKPAGLAADEIAYHVARLPEILEINQASPGQAATITRLLTTFASSGPSGIDAAAHDFAIAHLVVCRSTGALGLSGLDETATATLFEALYRGLLKAAAVIATHRDLLAAYLESRCWHQPTKPQDDAASPPTANANLRCALHERYGDRAGIDDIVDRSLRLHDTLLDDLDKLDAKTTGRYGKKIAKARSSVAAGQPRAADAELAAAEDVEIRAALSDIAGARQHLASAAHIRIMRGQLFETFGDFLRAANHYALAARHIPRTDHAMRWQLAEHQARALSLAAQFSNDPDTSSKADKIREEATGILPEWWRELQRDRQPPSTASQKAPLAPAVPLSHLLALIEGAGDDPVLVEQRSA
jgi:hypothetical protein